LEEKAKILKRCKYHQYWADCCSIKSVT